jgi:putative phage-type endonuclease
MMQRTIEDTATYTVERHSNRDDWLAARAKSIGGSDAAAVVNLSKYCGPLGLWHRKKDARVHEDQDEDDTDSMREWGHRHEPAVCRKWQEVSGLSAFDPGEFTIYRSKERPHVHATLDRDTGGDAVVEIKCAWYDAARVWGTAVPLSHQIQAQLQLYVTGKNTVHFAALLNGYKFRWLRVERNQRFIDRLLARVDDFWFNHVVANVQPPADFSEDTRLVLQKMYPTPRPESYHELGSDWRERIAEYDAAKAELAAAKKRVDEVANLVRQEMGEAEAAVLPGGGGGFTWKGPAGKRKLLRNKRLKARDE